VQITTNFWQTEHHDKYFQYAMQNECLYTCSCARLENKHAIIIQICSLRRFASRNVTQTSTSSFHAHYLHTWRHLRLMFTAPSVPKSVHFSVAYVWNSSSPFSNRTPHVTNHSLKMASTNTMGCTRMGLTASFTGLPAVQGYNHAIL
jgi:hypothetical protein